MGRRKAKRKKAERKAFWTIAYITAAAILISATGLPFRHALLQAEDSPLEKININAFASMSRTLSYYSWKGEVVLEGMITEEKFLSEYLTFHLDDHVVPFAKAEKADMVHKDGKYTFSVNLDTTQYEEGVHSLKVYDGEKSKQAFLSAKVYFSQKEYGAVTNVNEFCNMRSTPVSIPPVVTKVYLNEIVEILGSVKGEFRTEAGISTDIWYHVKYTTKGTEFEGYIFSAFISDYAIDDIGFSVEGMALEEFSKAKKTYSIYVPEDATHFSINRIVRHSGEDSIKVYLNEIEYTEALNSIPLSLKTTKIEVACMSSDGTIVADYTFNIGRISKASHDAFLVALEKFPKSYRDKLMVLHSMFPKWIFTPFDTGLIWNDVINAQDPKYPRTVSLIEKYVKPEYKKDDIIRDSSSFVIASRAAVEYYVDPRNFLQENNIFMFEQLSYNPDIHSLEGIEKIFSSYPVLKEKAEMFYIAGQQSGVSPYHLASRSKQEVTTRNPEVLSPIASGKFILKFCPAGSSTITEDMRYYNLFNFYNIGTGQNTNITLLHIRGLDFAKGYLVDGNFRFNTDYKTNDVLLPMFEEDESTERSAEGKLKYDLPWDTEQKAITGGAKFLAKDYISQGQDTLYLQKFDVDKGENGLFWHQYMQNIQAPFYESSATFRTYFQMDDLNNNFSFRIPIYLDMPDNSIPLPEETGRLNSLAVSGYPMVPSFDPFVTSGYSVVVPDEAETVDIKALGLDSRSIITGSGKINLLSGENKVDIVCTPPNGTAITYTLTITRNLPEKSSDNYLLSLSLKDIAFDRAFSTTDLGPYKASVLYDVTSATISAAQRSDTAKVTLPGKAGKVSLEPGINDFPVIITSENGRKREYKISIERIIPKITSDMLKLENGIVTGLDLTSTAGVLKTSLHMNSGTIEVYDKDGKAVPDNSMIGTGSCVKLLFNKEVIEEYKIVIYGDLNGDGLIDSADITLLTSGILRLQKFSGEFFAAADINKDGLIDSTDLTLVLRHILRLKWINQAT